MGGIGCRSCDRLRHSLGGSPPLKAESGSLSFGTAVPPPAAPHPVSRRRSCLRLLSRCSSRKDSDSHWLLSWLLRSHWIAMSPRDKSKRLIAPGRDDPPYVAAPACPPVCGSSAPVVSPIRRRGRRRYIPRNQKPQPHRQPLRPSPLIVLIPLPIPLFQQSPPHLPRRDLRRPLRARRAPGARGQRSAPTSLNSEYLS